MHRTIVVLLCGAVGVYLTFPLVSWFTRGHYSRGTGWSPLFGFLVSSALGAVVYELATRDPKIPRAVARRRRS
jgi:hypothetical protein